jgi:adenylate cyclase
VSSHQIEAHHGQVIDMAGDSVLAVFQTAAGAVAAAIAVQKELASPQTAAPAGRQMRFRIGVHLGDVIEKADGTVYGDGVNIAARLQALADPGGVTVSMRCAVQCGAGSAPSSSTRASSRSSTSSIRVRAFKVALAKGAGSATEALRLPDKPRLRCCRSTNMSGDPEQEYFADGITEGHHHRRLQDLRPVRDRAQLVVHLQEAERRHQGGGQKLGVRHVLEGSVRRAGMKVRINVQLIDAATGGHVWADRFDRDLEDIFLVQDEVTQRIVHSLQVRLTGSEKTTRDAGPREGRCRSLRPPHPRQDLPARLQRGADRRGAPDAGAGDRASTRRWRKPYAYLSLAGTIEYANAWNGRDESVLEPALALARKATEVDPLEPVSFHLARRCPDVAAPARRGRERGARSIELDPNSAHSHGSLGNALHFAGSTRRRSSRSSWR